MTDAALSGIDGPDNSGAILDFKITEGYVRCSRCGARCSNTVKAADKHGIVVRAWVECPECIEKTPDHEALYRSALEEIASRKTAKLAKFSADIAAAALEGRNYFVPDEDIPEEDRYGR